MDIQWTNDFSVSCYILAAIFSIVGVIQYKWPPKKINNLYGYRTNRSMKNQEVWDFAQIYSAKLFIKYGLIIAITSAIGWINPSTPNFITAILAFIGALFIGVKTDKELQKNFKNNDG